MPALRKRKINLLVPFLVIALVFGLLIWQKYRASRLPAPTPHVQQPSGTRTAVLFFVTGGSSLAREARELESCEGGDACAREVLEELFNGPVGELDDALPEGAMLKEVHLNGDTAVVDLNRSFADEMPSGSSAEMMAVFSIVDTLCINFPQITQVKLNIEGESNVQLRHLDLSTPLAPDYTLEQQSGQAAPLTSDSAKGTK